MWFTESPNQPTIKIGKYEYLSFQEKLWVKIFYHNSTNNVQFSNASEVISSNEPQKYSILNEIQPYHRIDNKYEFLLIYPGLENQFNQWRQRNAPHQETEIIGVNETIGYQPINISWTASYWGGLAKTVGGSAFISGSIGNGIWYYSIGRYKKVDEEWPDDSIPGPIAIGKEPILREVYLWMRVRHFTNSFKSPPTNIIKSHYSITVFVFVLISKS